MREAMSLQLLLWMSEYAYSGGAAIIKEDDPDANFVYAQLLKNCATPTLSSLMEALQQRLRLAREWQQFLSTYPVLLCPVSAEAPFPDLLDVESPAAFARVLEAQMTQIALPLMGMPALSVATRSGNAPMGVQLVSARFREDILLAAGADIESRNPAVGIAIAD
jgi:amidase